MARKKKLSEHAQYLAEMAKNLKPFEIYDDAVKLVERRIAQPVKNRMRSLKNAMLFTLAGLILGGGFAPLQEKKPVAPAPKPTALEEFATLIKGKKVSWDVKDAWRRANRGNPQGVKDLAYYAFNAKDGVPKDESLAVKLFHKAAKKGNKQAKRDLRYIAQLYARS